MQSIDASAPGAEVVRSALHPPTTRRGTVVRRALLDRVSEEASAKLVVVVAPAGWGKTSLLRDWSASGETSRAAWLSIDHGDNDPVRFWADVVAALGTVAPGIGIVGYEVLTAPGTKSARRLMQPVINDLARMPERVTLIIDDFHLITDETILECFSFFAEHLPPTLRLVLAGRSDPALPLPRLRAHGQLAEIGVDELRFSEAETAELLNGAFGLVLTPGDIHALQQRTEGWAAGLYLAGLSLRGCEDPARVIRTLAGDNRQIVDYFAAEVLAGQPARVRSLLLRTSVLNRLSGPLCDAVTGSGGSQALLEELERSQLFLMPLDTTRHWYRYHALFAGMLRRELDRSEPGLAPLLHRRASAWHRQHGSVADAIGHAISAADLADARELIASHWNLLLHQGLSETVDSLLDRLPAEMVIADARLCLIRGFAACWLGRLDEVEPWLVAAEAVAPQGPFTEGPSSVESAACLLRAAYWHMTGDLASAEAASQRPAELEASGNPWWRAMALAERGVNLFWRGYDAEAGRLLMQVVAPTQPPVNNLSSCWAEGCLSAIFLRRGDIESCERHLRKATDLADRYRLGACWTTATAILTSADLLTAQGQLTEAKKAALSALERARRGPARLETIAALLCLARISSKAGNNGDAHAHISEAQDLIGKCAAPGILSELMAETERLAAQHAPAAAPRPPGRALRSDGLTAREAQVLRLLAAGHTNNEIAAELVVSVHTVERHLQNAYRKIGVRNRADAAAYIVRQEGPCRSGIGPPAGPHAARAALETADHPNGTAQGPVELWGTRSLHSA